jgi:hypothetical protein
MGGGIAVSALLRSDLAQGLVRGLVLDAPMLDLKTTVTVQARAIGLPAPVIPAGRWLVARRFGVDWNALDYLARADELRVPALVFHGDADRLVPIATSDAFASRRPDLVQLHRVAGAGHIRSWNHGPEAYESAVCDFLTRVIPHEGGRTRTRGSRRG